MTVHSGHAQHMPGKKAKLRALARQTGGLAMLAAVAVGLVSGPVWSKSRHTGASRSTEHYAAKSLSASQIHKLENRLRPYVERRIGQKPASESTPPISDMDLLLMARAWKSLSPSFRKLYLSSLSIPSGFQSYSSPGGNFEVYYTTSGDSAVDPTDTYGFTAGSWRAKDNTPNGVPDYVDEVAWAFDSAWSMEIDRFGFGPPYAYIDPSHGSSKYKVVVLDVRDNYELYGMTYPQGHVSGDVGFRSYIEVRNDWSSPEWGRYRDNPLDAAHITCAHEFFHAIQYAGGHSEFPSYIDFFPVAWLEATAVLMEELAFDHVNDYIQYSEGYDGYFGNPHLSVLSDGAMSIDTYANGVVAMYIYWFGTSTPSISFIRTGFLLNEQNKTDFPAILDASCDTIGTTWGRLLNSFHTASFFSGRRADTSRFLRDGALLPEWSYVSDSVDENYSITKTIRPFSMETYTHGRTRADSDSLFVSFAPAENEDPGQWGASVLLRDSASGEVYPLSLNAVGTAQLIIADWKEWDEAIVVASNALSTESREATVFFTGFLLENLYVSESFEAYPNPVMRQSHGVLKIRGKHVVEVRLYSIDGKLVARANVHRGDGGQALQTVSNGFDWMLCNRDGEAVVPGTYMIVVSYRDTRNNRIKFKREPVLVLP